MHKMKGVMHLRGRHIGDRLGLSLLSLTVNQFIMNIF